MHTHYLTLLRHIAAVQNEKPDKTSHERSFLWKKGHEENGNRKAAPAHRPDNAKLVPFPMARRPTAEQ